MRRDHPMHRVSHLIYTLTAWGKKNEWAAKVSKQKIAELLQRGIRK